MITHFGFDLWIVQDVSGANAQSCSLSIPSVSYTTTKGHYEPQTNEYSLKINANLHRQPHETFQDWGIWIIFSCSWSRWNTGLANSALLLVTDQRFSCDWIKSCSCVRSDGLGWNFSTDIQSWLIIPFLQFIFVIHNWILQILPKLTFSIKGQRS